MPELPEAQSPGPWEMKLSARQTWGSQESPGELALPRVPGGYHDVPHGLKVVKCKFLTEEPSLPSLKKKDKDDSTNKGAVQEHNGQNCY